MKRIILTTASFLALCKGMANESLLNLDATTGFNIEDNQRYNRDGIQTGIGTFTSLSCGIFPWDFCKLTLESTYRYNKIDYVTKFYDYITGYSTHFRNHKTVESMALTANVFFKAYRNLFTGCGFVYMIPLTKNLSYYRPYTAIQVVSDLVFKETDRLALCFSSRCVFGRYSNLSYGLSFKYKI